MKYIKKYGLDIFFNFLWIGVILRLLDAPLLPLGWFKLHSIDLFAVLILYASWTGGRYGKK